MSSYHICRFQQYLTKSSPGEMNTWSLTTQPEVPWFIKILWSANIETYPPLFLPPYIRLCSVLLTSDFPTQKSKPRCSENPLSKSHHLLPQPLKLTLMCLLFHSCEPLSAWSLHSNQSNLFFSFNIKESIFRITHLLPTALRIKCLIGLF